MWLRDFGVFWARLAMYAMIAIMMGTEYLRMDLYVTTPKKTQKKKKPVTVGLTLFRSQDRLQDRMSILFFSCAFLVFMSVAAVPAFIEERGVCLH